MCQKKELLSSTQNGLRNPSNPLERLDLLRRERISQRSESRRRALALFTDELTTFLAQRALSKTLGLGGLKRRRFCKARS